MTRKCRTMRQRVLQRALWLVVFLPSFLIFNEARAQYDGTSMGALIAWSIVGLWVAFVAVVVLFVAGLRAKD